MFIALFSVTIKNNNNRTAFLTIGVMKASLMNQDEKWPAASERLNSSAKYGAIKSMT